MKKFFTLVLLALSFGVFAAAFDAANAVGQLKSTGMKLKFGKNETTGFYVICRETVQIQNGNLPEAQERAKMMARVSIAEFVSGAHIQLKSNSTETTKAAIINDQESFESVELLRKCVQKDVKQVQRGITICAMEKKDDNLTVYCLLVEKIVNAARQMADAVKELGPDTVQVSGVAYFGGNISLETAEKSALAEAQREAIAQVMGISITSSSASQTVSSEAIDNDGKETFNCDDSFKAKVFSSTAGFIETSRIVDKNVTPPAVMVTIVAKVARDKLMDDYRSYLESMGNPGFCVRSNDRDMLELYSGFFASLGLRMVDNLYDAAYIIDVTCRFINENGKLYAAVRAVAKDKTSGNVIFSQENDPEALSVNETSESAKAALCRRILAQMRPALHQKLNTFIGRANADGRPIQVKLGNYDSDYKSVAAVIQKALKMVPGASNVRMKISGDEVLYTLNFKTDAEDLADFLEKQIKVDVKRRSLRPVRGNVSNTLIEFNFE